MNLFIHKQIDIAHGDPDLRSSAGVTILNCAVPYPDGPAKKSGPPARCATSLLANSFGALYCVRFQCPPEKFEEDVLWRCLHPRSLGVARLIWFLYRGYFQPDFHLINEIRDLTAVDDVVHEITAARLQRPVRGLIRRLLRVRVSGQRLVNLANQLFKQPQ